MVKHSQSEKLLPNLKILFQYIWKINRKIYGVMVLDIIFSTIQPFPYMLLSKYLFDCLSSRNDFKVYLIYTVMFAVSSFLITEAVHLTDNAMKKKMVYFDFVCFRMMCEKALFIDYSLSSLPETKEKSNNAAKAINGGNCSIAILSIKSFFVSILTLLGVLSVLASISPTLLLFVIAIVGIQFLAAKKIKEAEI